MEKSLPHSFEFVELSQGTCHYRLEGPDQGRLLLMLHGGTVPGWQFERLLEELTGEGFRCLCPDFYGHGYSARPRVRHNHDLLVTQILELLVALDIEGPVAIVAHSMGAAVAARLLIAHPSRFGPVILTAPMMDFLGKQPLLKLLRIPLLGEIMMHVYLIPFLVRRRRRRYADIDGGRFGHLFREQLLVPGFGRSLLSLFRSGALGDQSSIYRKLAEVDVPLLLLRGEKDETCTAEDWQRLLALIPAADAIQLARANHALLLREQHWMVEQVLLFLLQHDDVS